jgi:hypothetical protein
MNNKDNKNRQQPVKEDADPQTDIKPEELDILDNAGHDGDDRHIQRATLEDTDEDGELLNEGTSATDISGADLDVPGSEEDDDNEEIGEEDEENNSYSLKDGDT